MAPVSSKQGASTAAKSGAGLLGKAPMGTSGKRASGNKFGTSSGSKLGSSGKSSTILVASGKRGGTFGSEKSAGGKSGGSVFGTEKSTTKMTAFERTPSMFGVNSGKSHNTHSSMTIKPSSNTDKVKSEKSSGIFGLGGKTSKTSSSGPYNQEKSSLFESSPDRIMSSTSSPFGGAAKKSSTGFGLIWLPTRRRNKKKDYVYVSHNTDYTDHRSPSMHNYDYMSGDSSQPLKKKEEDSSTLVLERPRGPIATAASAGTAVVAADQLHDKETNTFDADHDDKEDKFIQHDSEENKDAGGDASYREEKDDKSFLEDESVTSKSAKDREDKVDSVYLRPPLPHKARSNASTTDNDEDCGIKCLYYTLQCCDCVLQ